MKSKYYITIGLCFVTAAVIAATCRAKTLGRVYTGQVGQKIGIRAHDDFALAGVAVVIRKADGAVLEQGPTTLSSDSVWAYTTTAALPTGQTVMIKVTATDRPGHKTTKTQVKS